MSSRSNRQYNIVVLGAGGVGKSCLTAQFVQNIWIESYDPTIEDSYVKNLEVDGRQVMLEILDTAGTEQFTAMRELYMKTGQGFLLVFSLTNEASLAELTELREKIISIKADKHVPLVLVGNKSDLEDERRVSRKQAFAISQSWGQCPYYETSARRRANVDEVFKDLCRQIIRKDMQRAKAAGAPTASMQPPFRKEEVIETQSSRPVGSSSRQHRKRSRSHKRTGCIIL